MRARIATKTPEAKREGSVSRVKRAGRVRSLSSPVDRVLFLQRTIGNRAVRSLIESGHLQAKLRIGRPRDKYEQEADRVANAVMRMPEPYTERQVGPEEETEILQTTSLAYHITPLVQRQEELEEEEEEPIQAKPLAGQITPLVQRQVEEEEEELIQTQESKGQSSEITPEVESRIKSLKGGGQPLSKPTRAFFKPRFGYDFGQVRVHTNANAAYMAKAIDAKAFTVGQNVVFGAGQYAPEINKGRRLLAHELTHIIQQQHFEYIPSVQRQEEKPRTIYNLGMKITKHPDGKLEVEIIRPWKKGSGPASTYIGMAKVSGISSEHLAKELIACGAYKSIRQVKRGFRVGTRIIVDKGKIQEISVVGKVYKAGGKIKPDFNYFLEEGTRLFKRASFGSVIGIKHGPDPADSYDTSTWREIPQRSAIRAKVRPWRAMEKLVNNVDKKITKKDHTKPMWAFDCFQFTQLIRIYAYWRTMTISEFNKKFTPLELGFAAKTLRWSKSIEAEKPGELPFYYSGDFLVQEKGNKIEFIPKKVFVGKTWVKILNEAPIGSHITWTNRDAVKKCKQNPKLPFCDYCNVNTIKLGHDRYAAHPFGIVNEKTIKQKMAEAVFMYKKELIPSKYIDKNIYISLIRYPK